MVQLAEAGASTPEVGTELCDERGKVVADCELSWANEKLVVLRDDQADLAGAWQGQGWLTFTLDEQTESIGDEPWPDVVAQALGLTLVSKE